MRAASQRRVAALTRPHVEVVRVFKGRAIANLAEQQACSEALAKARAEWHALATEATDAVDPDLRRALLEVLRTRAIDALSGVKRSVLDRLEELRLKFPGDDLLFFHTARSTSGKTTFFRGATHPTSLRALGDAHARTGAQVVLPYCRTGPFPRVS